MRRFLLALACMSAPTQAHANWQYTTWGMSAVELVEVSQGRASLKNPAAADGDLIIMAEGTHTVGSVQLPASFLFENDKLVKISLRPRGDALCWALSQQLKREYGEPFTNVPSPVMSTTVWLDQAQGNRVEFLAMGDVCFLNYLPLSRPTGSGL